MRVPKPRLLKQRSLSNVTREDQPSMPFIKSQIILYTQMKKLFAAEDSFIVSKHEWQNEVKTSDDFNKYRSQVSEYVFLVSISWYERTRQIMFVKNCLELQLSLNSVTVCSTPCSAVPKSLRVERLACNKMVEFEIIKDESNEC